ncbi:hypothetical protein ACS0PU_006322 [Formica fusca]
MTVASREIFRIPTRYRSTVSILCYNFVQDCNIFVNCDIDVIIAIAVIVSLRRLASALWWTHIRSRLCSRHLLSCLNSCVYVPQKKKKKKKKEKNRESKAQFFIVKKKNRRCTSLSKPNYTKIVL